MAKGRIGPNKKPGPKKVKSKQRGRPVGVKEVRKRRSAETVPDLITGQLVKLPNIDARKRDFRVRMFRRKLLKAAPNLVDDKFAPVTLSFCRISILSMDIYRFLHQRGIQGLDGEIRASVDRYQRVVTTQLRLAEKLGLTPAAFRSVSDSNFDLIAEVAKARENGSVEDTETVDADADDEAAERD